MRHSNLCGVAVLALILIPASLLACLWDHDTLMMERSRFPSVLELITGKFLRHSKEFYEWRISDRLLRLEKDPDNLAFYDDLAVAYDKTGQNGKAIEMMIKKEAKKPGLYETYANLGTFYIHGGQAENGLEYIDRALKLNPDAHFGREKYQRLLVEFILLRKKEGILAPPFSRKDSLRDPLAEGASSPMLRKAADYSSFVLDQNSQRVGNRYGQESERQEAIKGVLGMMKFGNYDSPILLEALGGLLSSGVTDDRSNDGKRLAARAYLKASYLSKGESAKRAYRELAKYVLEMQTRHPDTNTPVELEELEPAFLNELKAGAEWFAELRMNELNWIKEGKNPELEFDRLYAEEPQLPPSVEGEPPFFTTRTIVTLIFGGIGILLVTTVALLIRNSIRGRRPIRVES